MPERDTTTRQETTSPLKTGRTNVCADIAVLARSATTRHAFLIQALRKVGSSLASPYAALYVRGASSVTEEEWHTGPTDPRFWKPTIQAFLSDSLTDGEARAKLLNPKRGTTKYAMLFAPIAEASGSTVGGIALVIVCQDQADAAGRLAVLEAATGLISYAADLIETTRAGSDAPAAAAPNQALARTGAVTTPEELAFSITNSLRNKLGCEQVALGLVLRKRVKLLSISGLDEVAHQSPGVVHLRAAMEECLDADGPIVAQSEKGWESERMTTGHRLHRQWHTAAKGDAVASIPLKVGDQTVAVLSLRRGRKQTFNPELIREIRQRVEPYAPALLLTRRAARGLLRHARDNAGSMIERITSRHNHGPKMIAALVVVASLWFVFGKAGYDLTVPCTITPRQVRNISVPFDGILASASVIAGDHVARGDVLAELDRRELEQQRAVLRAKLTVLEHEQDRARADDSPIEVQLAKSQALLTQAQLDILEAKIEQAVIRTPIDGVIIDGDLRPMIGGVLARGDPMLAIAPRDGWTLELQVPEADADELSLGLSGSFAPYARPERTLALNISRVRPTAEVPKDKNVYVAEADIDDLPFTWMRPGMEGTAKIHIGSRPIWWIALHRALDFVRLNLWL